MATNVTIGGSGALFVGEDKTLILEILDAADVPVDASAWTIQFVVRRSASEADPALLDKTASITGVYNAVRATNTQRATVALSSADMDALTANAYQYSWKRINSGSETILAYGSFVVQRATAR